MAPALTSSSSEPICRRTMVYPAASISREMVFSTSEKKMFPVPRTTTPTASLWLRTRSRALLLGM